MRWAVAPLTIVGLAQWGASAWWQRVDGIVVDVSFRSICIDLLGAEPRVAWDPAERLLAALLALNPGSVCLALAGYLLVRSALARWATDRSRRLLVDRHRRELRG